MLPYLFEVVIKYAYLVPAPPPALLLLKLVPVPPPLLLLKLLDEKNEIKCFYTYFQAVAKYAYLVPEPLPPLLLLKLLKEKKNCLNMLNYDNSLNI